MLTDWCWQFKPLSCHSADKQMTQTDSQTKSQTPLNGKAIGMDNKAIYISVSEPTNGTELNKSTQLQDAFNGHTRQHHNYT